MMISFVEELPLIVKDEMHDTLINIEIEAEIWSEKMKIKLHSSVDFFCKQTNGFEMLNLTSGEIWGSQQNLKMLKFKKVKSHSNPT